MILKNIILLYYKMFVLLILFFKIKLVVSMFNYHRMIQRLTHFIRYLKFSKIKHI